MSKPAVPKLEAPPGGDARALNAIVASIKRGDVYRCPKCKLDMATEEEARKHVYGHVLELLSGGLGKVSR